MTRDQFDQSFERLRVASNRHAEIAKDPDKFDDIAASRIELEAARAANTADRRTVVSRNDYPTPDFIPPGLGVEGGMSKRTRIMATIGAVVFFATVATAGWLAVRTVDRPVFVDGDIVETLRTERPCRWLLDVPVTNSTDAPVTVLGIEAVINGDKHAPSTPPVQIATGATAALTASFNPGGCPTSTDEINHGSIWIVWSNGTTESSTKHRF